MIKNYLEIMSLKLNDYKHKWDMYHDTFSDTSFFIFSCPTCPGPNPSLIVLKFKQDSVLDCNNKIIDPKVMVVCNNCSDLLLKQDFLIINDKIFRYMKLESFDIMCYINSSFPFFVVLNNSENLQKLKEFKERDLEIETIESINILEISKSFLKIQHKIYQIDDYLVYIFDKVKL